MTIAELYEDFVRDFTRLLVERVSRADGGTYPPLKTMLQSAFYAGAFAALREIDVEDTPKRTQLLAEIEARIQ